MQLIRPLTLQCDTVLVAATKHGIKVKDSIEGLLRRINISNARMAPAEALSHIIYHLQSSRVFRRPQLRNLTRPSRVSPPVRILAASSHIMYWHTVQSLPVWRGVRSADMRKTSQPTEPIQIWCMFGSLNLTAQYPGPNLKITPKIPPPYSDNTARISAFKCCRPLDTRL